MAFYLTYSRKDRHSAVVNGFIWFFARGDRSIEQSKEIIYFFKLQHLSLAEMTPRYISYYIRQISSQSTDIGISYIINVVDSYKNETQPIWLILIKKCEQANEKLLLYPRNKYIYKVVYIWRSNRVGRIPDMEHRAFLCDWEWTGSYRKRTVAAAITQRTPPPCFLPT